MRRALSSPYRAMQVCGAMCFCSPECESRDFRAFDGTKTSGVRSVMCIAERDSALQHIFTGNPLRCRPRCKHHRKCDAGKVLFLYFPWKVPLLPPLPTLRPALPLPALLPAPFQIWPDSDSVPGHQDRKLGQVLNIFCSLRVLCPTYLWGRATEVSSAPWATKSLLHNFVLRQLM